MKILHKFLLIVLAVALTLGLVGLVKAAATTVDLGTAGNFAVLAGSGITNTGATTVSGDVGSSPIPTENGFTGANSVTFASGANHIVANPNDVATQGAKDDLILAYEDARDQDDGAVTVVFADETDSFAALNNNLAPGIYNSASSMGVTGNLKLDAAGDPDAVFIFQAGSTLTTASDSVIDLANGTQACHVFWQVGSSATLGTGTDFAGNILALTSITATTGVTVDGRLLARDGAVTLDTNTITAATCGAPLIHVAKTATPATLAAGGGSVTYDYTVTNTGTVIMNNITVTDNKCANIVWGQGDADDDDRLDFDETWLYSCTTTLTETTTNRVTATGDANDYTATDTADVTVTVTPAPPATPPLINIAKLPDPLASLTPTSVTYDYTVTNVGTVAMSDITVSDNKCAPVVYVSGDTNLNSELGTTEAWHYGCTATVSQTTTNTATATGEANGFTATDTVNATVVIGSLTPAPLIHLVKTPDVFVLPIGGGLITLILSQTPAQRI